MDRMHIIFCSPYSDLREVEAIILLEEKEQELHFQEDEEKEEEEAGETDDESVALDANEVVDESTSLIGANSL